MEIEIVKAQPGDAGAIAEILQEAASWLEEKNAALWSRDRITIEKVAPEAEARMFWLAQIEGENAGCVRYQETDEEYWGDVPHSDSAFIHRLAVKRKFSGGGVSKALVNWAKEKARAEGKSYLRLDCANRENLRAVYENYGFKFHSIKEKEPYPVVRYEFKL